MVSENKGHWAKATEVRGFGSLNAGDYGEVTAISCAAAGYCTLGGSYLDSSDLRQAFLATEAKGRWGHAQRLPGMSGLNHGGNAGLNALPCASAGNCVAGGSSRPSTSSTHTQAYLAVQKIGHRGNAAEVPGTASLNAGGGAQVTAASCPAVGACVAGGFYENGSGRLRLFLVSQHNGHWGTAGKMPGLLAVSGRAVGGRSRGAAATGG